MMTHKEIAKMTTEIIRSAVTSPIVGWTCKDICSAYKEVFKTIQETVNEKIEKEPY